MAVPNKKQETSSESSERIDVDAIMKRIRENTLEQCERAGVKVRPYIPPASSGADSRANPILYSEELNYLNANWNDWALTEEFSSHRPLIGSLISKCKTRIRDFLWQSIFQGYFERERQFNMHLVRHLNASARYIDARDAEIFWQLVTKIDNDIVSVNERADRLYEETQVRSDAELNAVRERCAELGEARAADAARMRELQKDVESLSRSLKSVQTEVTFTSDAIAGRGGAKLPELLEPTESRRTEGDAAQPQLLERRMREAVRADACYEFLRELCAAQFQGVSEVIVELGCADGALVQALQQAGFEMFGVETDPVYAGVCEKKGLPVLHSEYLSYLEQLPDRSIDGIIARDFLGSTTAVEFERFLSLAERKLRPGRKIILQSSDPRTLSGLGAQSPRTLAGLDGLHPDALTLMMEAKGLEVHAVLRGGRSAAEPQLESIVVPEFAPSQWQGTLQNLNRSIARLNEVLFGDSFYCAVGVVPTPQPNGAQ